MSICGWEGVQGWNSGPSATAEVKDFVGGEGRGGMAGLRGLSSSSRYVNATGQLLENHCH